MKIFFTLLWFFVAGNVEQYYFKVELSQNNQIVEIQDKVVKVEKMPFTFLLTLPRLETNEKLKSVNFIATFNKNLYDQMVGGKTIKEVLKNKNFSYAADGMNAGKFIVVGENAYNTWYYSNDTIDNAVKEYKLVGNSISCKIDVQRFYFDGVEGYPNGLFPINQVENSKLYFYFEMTDSLGNVKKKDNLEVRFR
jgi:hypothetical protein